MRTPDDWRKWSRRMARADGHTTVILWPCRCGRTLSRLPDQVLACCQEEDES